MNVGVGRVPDRRVRVPMLLQRWEHVAFLHWRFPPAALRPLVPAPFEVATCDGSAWVTIVSFVASGTRPPLPVPPLPPFAETNLRTYVVGADGREALQFLSLEASSTVTVAAARAGAGLPYHRARTSVTAADGCLRYRSRRASGVGHDFEVRPGEPLGAARSILDDWLTGRWRAVTTHCGADLALQVEHPPWALRRATVARLEEDLLASCGLRRPDEGPVAHVGGPVEVRLSLPRPA